MRGELTDMPSEINWPELLSKRGYNLVSDYDDRGPLLEIYYGPELVGKGRTADEILMLVDSYEREELRESGKVESKAG